MPPMRANSPTDSGFQVLNPVEDSPQLLDPTIEMKQLAKAAKSPDGKIILDHLKSKIDQYTNTLKSQDFTKADSTIALATVMSNQMMIKEFETVLADVEFSKQVISDASKRRARA